MGKSEAWRGKGGYLRLSFYPRLREPSSVVKGYIFLMKCNSLPYTVLARRVHPIKTSADL